LAGTVGSVKSLNCRRVIAVDKNSKEHRLRSRLRDEVINQVEHEFGLVPRARQNRDEIRVPDIRNPFVADYAVALLRDEVVDKPLEIGLGCL
jgi:hypothetical protein